MFDREFTTMGMGAYDESEQNRREESKDVDDSEAVTTSKYDGDVSYETPDSVDDLLDNFEG